MHYGGNPVLPGGKGVLILGLRVGVRRLRRPLRRHVAAAKDDRGWDVEQTMDRRRFLVIAAGGAALGAFVVLQGCGGGSDGGDGTPEPEPPTTPEPPTFTDKRASISSNHGHSATLTAAQQEAAVDATVPLSSGTDPGPHTHTVRLSAADVAAIAAGSRVSRTSTTDLGHNHSVSFN